MLSLYLSDLLNGSLPTRERGLKFKYLCPNGIHKIVAPHTGAWIEIEK